MPPPPPPATPPSANAPARADSPEAAELERVLAAPAFAGALAHQRLLRYLAEHSLSGQANMLKETAIAIEVFQRPADRYDPRSDSIVRVEARRLRERLRRHYEAEPDRAGPRLHLPKGSYKLHWTAARPDPHSEQARELVARGRYLLLQGHEDGHRKALARFEEAAAAAPDMADAHSGLARSWLQLVTTNIEPPLPGIQHALVAVRRALELQPHQAESLVLAAQLTHRFDYDWPRAQPLFLRAAQAAPDSAHVRHALAFSLMMRADFLQAEQELAAARQLDPMHLSLRAHSALLHLYRHQWQAAETVLQALLDMSADNVLGMSLLAYVALCRGDAAGALKQYRAVSQRHAALSIGRAGEVQALAALGETAAARELLQALKDEAPGRYLSPYQLAMAEMRLGQGDQALVLLARAVDGRDPNAWCLFVDPAFEALHGRADFQALVQRVHGQALARAVR